MTVEFIGSVVRARQGPTGSDPDYPVKAAARVDDAGFDQLLIGYSSTAPDGLLVANEVLTTTSRLGVVVTQLPGLIAPTVAARQFATLAAFHPGRVSLHVAADAADAAGGGGHLEGDGVGPADRCARAAEFFEVVRLAWQSPLAFDYSGEFYRVAGAYSAVRPPDGRLPIYFAAASDAAARVAAAYADVCVLGAAPVPLVAQRIAKIRAAAARHGRSPRFGVSLSWPASSAPQSLGSRFGGDAPLWLPSGLLPAGQVAAGQVGLAGSEDQLAHDVLDYLEVGVSTLVLGHDPLVDAAACAEVIARVRDERFSAVARRRGRG